MQYKITLLTLYAMSASSSYKFKRMYFLESGIKVGRWELIFELMIILDSNSKNIKT